MPQYAVNQHDNAARNESSRDGFYLNSFQIWARSVNTKTVLFCHLPNIYTASSLQAVQEGGRGGGDVKENSGMLFGWQIAPPIRFSLFETLQLTAFFFVVVFSSKKSKNINL